MPSLKCMFFDKWLHKGQISQEEYDAVIKKLDGHDKQIIADMLKPYDAESIEELVDNAYLKGGKDIISKIKKELKTIYPSKYTDYPIEKSGILLRFKEVFELLERVENDIQG